jgi:hypothetical protein
MAEILESQRQRCVEQVAENAWRDMRKGNAGLPEWPNLPESMKAPLREQVKATLAPIWPILEGN